MELSLVDEHGLSCLLVQADHSKLGLFLDDAPLLLREELLHSMVHAAHMLNPADYLQFLHDHFVLDVGEPVPAVLAPLASPAEKTLQTEFDACEEVDGNSFEHVGYLFLLFGVRCIKLTHLGRVCLRFVFFIAVTDQIRMLADVADDRLVLEYNDSDGEKGTERPSETSYITEEIENIVDGAPDDCEILTELISDGQLNIIREIIKS